MKELAAPQVRIRDGFWGPRLEMNAGAALDHQWQQLEKTGCIENFRLVAEGKAGFREGRVFADSDAYKWLDAAARVYAIQPSEGLRQRMDGLVELIGRAQADDGYIYTYNQVHFPQVRWTNLQIEHELYCHGHLIEAAVSHYQATGKRHLLEIGEKAADLLVRDFLRGGPEGTPGHQEIEIALIRLYRATGKEEYLALAEHFLEQRGRIRGFWRQFSGQNRSARQRRALVEKRRAEYMDKHPEARAFRLPAGNVSRKPPGIQLRYYLGALTGKYFQQHRPVREQKVPVGHAVRFAYMETALAMLYRERGDESLLLALEDAWAHMVNRRMYVTGGIGSLPEIEGFGRDYELDPEHAYAETCAALGCMFWNWEMTLSTGRAMYADLLEWQLYNAAAVGMGLEGVSYLYNNPLACRGGVTRQAWYEVPCCPSNLSRTWAWLGKYIYSHDEDQLWVHQYIGSETAIELGSPVRVKMTSELPWQGQVRLTVWPESAAPFTVHLRVPSWAAGADGGYRLELNGEALPAAPPPQEESVPKEPASGYSPYGAFYVPVSRTWSPGDTVELELPTPIRVRRAAPRVKSARGKGALTRGPLVYCLERGDGVGSDNAGLDLFEARLDPSTLEAEWSPAHFDGIWVLRAKTVSGEALTAIPYAYWANRGESQMTVWIKR